MNDEHRGNILDAANSLTDRPRSRRLLLDVANSLGIDETPAQASRREQLEENVTDCERRLLRYALRIGAAEYNQEAATQQVRRASDRLLLARQELAQFLSSYPVTSAVLLGALTYPA